MIFLLFRATRKRPRPVWAFWERRSTADVFAFIPLDNTEDARLRAHTDMETRGWTIDHFERVRKVDHDFPQADWSVRWHIRQASKGTPVYNFYKPLDFGTERHGDAKAVVSRYMDTPGVRLDPTRVPENLRPLLRFANAWAIGDDVERGRLVADTPLEDKKEFVRAVVPHFEDIERYSQAHANSEPVPHEVIVLNLLAEAADVASNHLEK